ncbi:MAG: transcription-repair coupling factor [Gammaproteobacteria bacterium]|nr:transcription-repair coupling factor [Gammaproteobacteria bacterium]NIM71609.1 transcription-repair coupling factor [Gammaproteobacteria bacterium]NIN37157.1 transcription-repair coupling factor [Gammaproteobacteria bacterium]NIO23349.1 transcription-repair coupling factor [Gammaproteobacteria bacterium]NIO63977.1 transcription-repair coupling factor [Gammaproteobacteria bacterium]
MSEHENLSVLDPRLPPAAGACRRWTSLYGSSRGLAIAGAARNHAGPLMVVTPDAACAQRLEEEIRFFLGAAVEQTPIVNFPDWETLPYDTFSPHQDIVSERLATLSRLSTLECGVLIVPITTLMVRIAPRTYLDANCLLLGRGDRLDLTEMRGRLELAGYRYVSQVMEHGEFAVRGSLMDLFPMGSPFPLRIDLLDDEIDSIRTFNAETQRSVETVDEIRLLPAREFPLTPESIALFRSQWRIHFEGDPTACPVYRDVSQNLAPAGIEYYLGLFFETTATLFDYLRDDTLVVTLEDTHDAATHFWEEIGERYEQRRHDRERPLLPPAEVFMPVDTVCAGLERYAQIRIGRFDADESCDRFATRVPTALPVDARAERPLAVLKDFLERFPGRVLFVAETPGRREALHDTLTTHGVEVSPYHSWRDFLADEARLGLTVAPLEEGAVLLEPAIAIVSEPQLFGERVVQRRRRRTGGRDAESIVRDLSELNLGAPVVHESHGVGRYRGLQTVSTEHMSGEFLCIEYADGDKLYVPVSSLHLVSRYTGADADHAPLHKLGSPQWQKARKKAARKAFDVAAELLDIQARRAARPGHCFDLHQSELRSFVQGFRFEETPDQQATIDAVLDDMASDRPMDRLVCGDVGFGKTEVAMRAAFVAVEDGWQVAILVPTTLLAQQHHQTFSDRFADWPVRVEQLSRFRSRKDRDAVVEDLAAGKIDIVIGTHRLLQPEIRFKRLGLVIVDEEHRFGVRQKERLKSLRAQADVLTLTATPIPRTLNLALSGLRDLSLIATPPERRLSIKTFVRQWDNALIREAFLREIHRGGQVYFVHNKVETIDRMARELRELVPEVDLRIAHGQMRERELERTMLDFYHRRFNVLVCTTIIETGIDVPSANTIIINRADHFGLAQLHQLRGRVGRSHHRAYAYLIVPQQRAMTADAVKRLEAIESLEDLGIGFSLATHDLEIRGAGEILGEEQSGQIQEIGYSLYTRLLERAVEALKAGRTPELDRALDHGAEIDLRVPALIPEDYLPDVHARLIMYKRIASARNSDELHELKVEMIDRFGLLPEAVRNLFDITELKLKATPLGIRKIDVGRDGGRIVFAAKPQVDPASIVRLIQKEPTTYKFDGTDRLRFSMQLETGGARIDALDHLLDALSLRDAA